MRTVFLVLAIAALAIVVADPARAKHRKHAERCVDRPYEFSWRSLLPNRPGPQPNGCSPPVYQHGQYVGQDPDPNIRLQLLRDPQSGYSSGQY
jgi:hypothetical protein